jgi:ribosomal protein S12 methylthiotransferase accessory factor YcaO
MPTDPRPSSISKLREFCHGFGEVFGFAWAALASVVEILSGRGPEVSQRRRKQPALDASEEAADRVAPYPIQDG